MKINLFITCIAFIALGACKKSNDSKTITGYWQGQTNASGPFVPASAMSWLVRSDNTLTVYIGPDSATATKGTGTYTNTDSTINAQYRFPGSPIASVVSGKVNANFTRIDGKDALGLSTFTLTK
jgi:hypothetical protein